jgi:heme/copper-type cytochrome/quinol oxidase subunit 1
MDRRELALQKTLNRIAFWIAFAGGNLIALLTYLLLWVENPRRLPIILAFLPVQVVADIFLLRCRDDWKPMKMTAWLTFAILGWFTLSAIQNREWYFLPAIAFGCMMLIWRFSRLKKREIHDGTEE